MTVKRTSIPEDQTTFVNPNPIDDVELEIYHKKKPNRTDPFFYDQGIKIAEFTYKDWKIYACPDGEIRIIDKLEQSEIRNADVPEYWDSLTDKELRDCNRFTWENNNWFEISATTPSGDFVDLGIAEHDYDSAIQSMRDVLKTLMEKGELP